MIRIGLRIGLHIGLMDGIRQIISGLTFRLLAESSDTLTTEAADPLRTE